METQMTERCGINLQGPLVAAWLCRGEPPVLHGYFTLNGKEVVEAESLTEWSAWCFAAMQRDVARTNWRGVVVETIFTGVDARAAPDEGRPLVFETRLGTEVVGRYDCWDAAARGHQREIERLRAPAWRR
jgi:hypothetical protein